MHVVPNEDLGEGDSEHFHQPEELVQSLPVLLVTPESAGHENLFASVVGPALLSYFPTLISAQYFDECNGNISSIGFL